MENTTSTHERMPGWMDGDEDGCRSDLLARLDY